MEQATVVPDATVEQVAVNERADALLELVAGLSPESPEQAFDALTQTLVDALLERDDATMETATEALRRCERAFATSGEPLGRVRGLLALAFAALERLTTRSTVQEIGVNTHAHRMLLALRRQGSLRSSQLAELLDVSATEISRTGRALTRHGLAVRTKAGRDVYWDLSPRGRDLLARLDRRSRGIVSRASRRRPELSTEPVAMTQAVSESHRLMTNLLHERKDELMRRLFVWESFRDFAQAPPKFDSGSDVGAQWLTHFPLLADKRLSELWPATPPSWDAHAVVQGAKGSKGLVLFEAKSRPLEFRDDQVVGSELERSRVFERRYPEARRYLEVGKGADWRRTYPDPASRLAFLYFLRVRCEIPTWMVDVFFVDGGAAEVPSSEEQWQSYLVDVRQHLKLPDTHALSPYVRDEFVLAPESPLAVAM
jgi:DNA-binding MarR family transcriptional regulator